MSRLAGTILRKIDWLDHYWSRAVERFRHHLVSKVVQERAGRRFEFTRTWIDDGGLDGRGKRLASDHKRLSVVVATYRQHDELACLLHAFAVQTLQSFELLVLHDGPDAGTREMVQRFIAEHPAVPCRYVESDKRYNDYGHSLRQIGIEQAACEFILITNGDNYYAPRFVEFALDAIDQFQLDMLLFDMVHSHFGYIPLSTQPLRFRVDMGSFLVRTEMAKRVGFRDKTFEGDAAYLEDLLGEQTGPARVGKLCKTLLVHN